MFHASEGKGTIRKRYSNHAASLLLSYDSSALSPLYQIGLFDYRSSCTQEFPGGVVVLEESWEKNDESGSGTSKRLITSQRCNIPHLCSLAFMSAHQLMIYQVSILFNQGVLISHSASSSDMGISRLISHVVPCDDSVDMSNQSCAEDYL